MGAFSIWHIVVIAIVAAFLFFGWKQLPDMARSFGRSLRVFKTEIKGMGEDDAARDKARGEAGDESAQDARPAQPKQLAPRPAPAREIPRAEVVRNTDAPASRPRPAPGPRVSR